MNEMYNSLTLFMARFRDVNEMYNSLTLFMARFRANNKRRATHPVRPVRARTPSVACCVDGLSCPPHPRIKTKRRGRSAEHERNSQVICGSL